MIAKLFFPILILLMTSCYVTEKATVNSSYTYGVLRDKNGLGCCKFLIEISNGDGTTHTFIPLNLEDFIIAPYEGCQVKFTYDVLNTASCCMAGTTISLKECY